MYLKIARTELSTEMCDVGIMMMIIAMRMLLILAMFLIKLTMKHVVEQARNTRDSHAQFISVEYDEGEVWGERDS